MCGGGTQVIQPQPQPQPSTADAVREWVQSMPQIYQTQMQYAPLQAQQQVELAQQYALPLGQAMQQAQAAMYPETQALQEQMAQQAGAGMQEGVPDWMRQQYLSNMRAQLGEQAGAGIGADYMSTGLMQLNQDWQNYYRNLGLSLAGRQPLATPSMPATTDYMSGYTPQSTMNFMQQGYGAYTQAARPFAVQEQGTNWMGGIGGLMGGIGAMGQAGLFGAATLPFI